MAPQPVWKPEKTFWISYALAWLPYLTGLFMVFKNERASFSFALLEAAHIVIPLEIAGLWIIWMVRKVPWDQGAKQFFFAKQVAMALVFIFVTMFIITLLGGILEWWHTARFSFQLIGPLSPFIIFNNLMIYATISAICYGLQLSVSLQHQARRATQAEILRTQAELQAMRAQLNPHFLFNTLHSLQALVRIAPHQAEEALDQFGDLMRYPLRVQSQMIDEVPLEEEWRFIRNYLDLEKLRLGDRLVFIADMDEETFNCPVPPLILQPLVENAVRYAVEPRSAGATIRLRARKRDGRLLLTVSDDGPGRERHAWQEAEGIGLRVARKRFQVLYGETASFEVETAPGKGFTVTMNLPVKGRQGHPGEEKTNL